jgi:hypothetical protein
MSLTEKQKRLLQTIVAEPAMADVKFGELQRLLTALGAKSIRSETGRTAFALPGGVILVLTWLNSQESVRGYQLASLNQALRRAGLAEK